MSTGDDVERLVKELGALQRGRGLQAADVATTVGPTVARALALEQHADAGRRREALASGLLGHVDALPPDLRFVFVNACAIPPRLPRLFGERLEAIADRLPVPVSVRTVRRRLAVANRRVAETLAGDLVRRLDGPSTAWVLTALEATTDLTVARPVFRSRHTLRVVAPALAEITERISFPGAPPDADPEFEADGHATLVKVDRPFQTTWELTMRLGRTFTCGQTVSYGLTVRAPSRRLVHPMSVMLPERECRRFSTEVDFGIPSVASRVWRLDGVPAPVAQLDEVSGELLDPHTTPVLRAAYDGMVRGRVYGLRWEWADGEPSDPAG